MAGLHFDITGDNSNFLRKLDEARNGIRSTSKQIEESGMGIEQMFGRMAKGAAAFGVGITAKEIVSNVVRIRGEFQQLEVAFNTMLGSKEKADALMQQLVKTAATTPFDLQSVAKGAKQLLAYGSNVDNVNNEIVTLGNVAAGVSVPLGDLVYLYGTLRSQGRAYSVDIKQFAGRGVPIYAELAKVLGVNVEKVNALVEAGKVGFPQVEQAFKNMTSAGSMFNNLMQEQSKTITGQISNIEDSISMMYNNIGKSSEGFINDALSGVSYLVENYETVGKTIMELAVTYGAYKAVLMSVAAYQGVVTGIAYTAEITELSKLIPLKQQSANQDVVTAVASGKLTQSKAEQVIALRAEIAAKIQSLQATEAQTKAEYASAMASYKNATQRMLLAKQNMAIAQSQMSIAIKSGTVDEIAAAKKNAQTASLELNNSAVVKNTAHKSLNIAATNRKTASEALNTLETGKNSVAQTVNTTSTNILTTAKTRLAAASKALGLSMLANQYVLATAAIVGLGYGIYKLVTYQTDAEKAQLKLNDAVKESEKAALSEQRELAKLKGELSATTKGTDEYNMIRDKIVSNYGKYDKNLKDEIDKVGLLDETYQNLTKSIQQSFNVRQYDKFKQEQGAVLDDVMSGNLDSMYDKLVGKWGDELGAKYYTEIKNALMAGEEIPKHLNNVVSNMYGVWAQSLHGHINNIREAQKATEEANKKAIVKFGVEDGSGNNGEGGKNDGTTKRLSSVSEEIKTVTAKIAKLKQELSDLRSGKTSVEAGKTVKDVIEGKVKDLKAAEDALSTLTGKDSAADKKSSDEQKKALETSKKLNEELLSLRLQNQQAEINLMAEGSEKKIAQINLDYDKEIAAILAKEKEWKEAQGGKLTQEQTVEIRTSLIQSYAKKEKSTGLVSSEQLAEEKRMMNEYLAAYGGYQEKRKAITEKYNDLIAKATTEGERKSLGEEMKKSLATVDDEVSKKTSIITKLFSDMSNRTSADIRAIADEAKKMLDYVNAGEFKTDDNGKGLFGMTKEQFDILSKSPDQLQSVKDEITNVRQEADQCETSFNKISGGLKKVFSAGDDNKKLKEGLAEIEAGMNDVMQAGQFLADSFSAIGDAFGSDLMSGIADGLNVAMDAMDSAMQGAKAGAMFGPIGAAAGAAIGVVTSLATSIAKIHDGKNEKRIQRLQDQIDTLDKSYELLGDSIEKAYSKDASKLIDDQNKLLEQQKILIQQQIQEEDDKKKTDNDKIKDWQNQLEEIDKTLADNKEKAVDAIFGEDLQSAIDNFAQAYADAWTSNTDKAQSAKDTVKKMMRQMVTESIKAAVESSKSMEKIREKLKEFYADNVLSSWEQDYIYNMAEGLQKELDGQFGWADKLMKDEKDPLFSSDSIADTILDGLQSGKSGIKDFTDSFEDMMKDAFLNSLKTKYLEGPLKEFSKKFSELSESGGQLTEAEIEELRGMYADIIDGAKAQFDSMKDIAGLDFTMDSDNSLKGAYAKADQESITLLAGQTGASRKIQEEILNSMIPIREQMQAIREMNAKGWEDVRVIRDLTIKIDKNTEQVAENTRQIKEVADKVADNTRNTVDALEGTINVKIKGM